MPVCKKTQLNFPQLRGWTTDTEGNKVGLHAEK